MKIVFVLFVDRNASKDYSCWTNIGYLVSSIKKIAELDVEVIFFDNNIHGKEMALKDISAIKPDIIAMSLLQNNFTISLEFAETYKKSHDAFIIIGNIMANLYPDYIMSRYRSIDCISLNEGEETLKELFSNMLNGQSIADVAGIVYRDENDKITKTQYREMPDIHSLSYPDRSFYVNRQSIFSIIGSRACSGRCSFCESNIISKRLRRRCISDIAEEMKYLVEELNCKYICFHDPTFCDKNDNRLKELYDNLCVKNIWVQFFINLRAEFINPYTINDIVNLKSKGLEKIFIGFEAGNEEDLALYNKVSKLCDNYLAVEQLKKVGIIDLQNAIEVEYGFININPYSTKEKLNQNIDFLVQTTLCVTPQVLSRRLLISDGSTITKRMRIDGLVHGEVNEPLLNPHAYKFVYPYMEDILKTILYVDEKAGIRNYKELICLHERMKHFNLNRYSDQDVYQELRYYQLHISQFSLDLFSYIVNDMKDYSNYYFINLKIAEFNEKVAESIQKLNIYISEYSKALYKINELVY